MVARPTHLSATNFGQVKLCPDLFAYKVKSPMRSQTLEKLDPEVQRLKRLRALTALLNWKVMTGIRYCQHIQAPNGLEFSCTHLGDTIWWKYETGYDHNALLYISMSCGTGVGSSWPFMNVAMGINNIWQSLTTLQRVTAYKQPYCRLLLTQASATRPFWGHRRKGEWGRETESSLALSYPADRMPLQWLPLQSCEHNKLKRNEAILRHEYVELMYPCHVL